MSLGIKVVDEEMDHLYIYNQSLMVWVPDGARVDYTPADLWKSLVERLLAAHAQKEALSVSSLYLRYLKQI